MVRRPARGSLQDLVAFLAEIQAASVGLYLHQQGVDTTSPAGRALFQMPGVFAEFERALIVERGRVGMQRAKREGKHPAGLASLSPCDAFGLAADTTPTSTGRGRTRCA